MWYHTAAWLADAILTGDMWVGVSLSGLEADTETADDVHATMAFIQVAGCDVSLIVCTGVAKWLACTNSNACQYYHPW